EINYRRFFDINDLAAVRVEDPEVFRATHALLLILVRLGAVTGIRIDHPDGLRDPAEHLRRLQLASFVERYADEAKQLFPAEAERREIEAALGGLFEELRQDSSQAELLRPMYMVVEKILALDEQLRTDWLAHGTTG